SKSIAWEHQEEEPGTQKVRVWGDTAVVTAKLWVKGSEGGKGFVPQALVQRHLRANPDRMALRLRSGVAASAVAPSAILLHRMRTLIVGIGALGGIIGGRLLAAGSPVSLATRDAESARRLRASGLRVTGIGGDASAEAARVAALGDVAETFELIVLATKAKD